MDKINHPSHYNIAGKKECIEQMMEDYGKTVTVAFCLGNAYKYIYRAGEKEGNSKEDDLQKAKWYFDFVNNRLYSFVKNKYLVKLYVFVKNTVEKL